MRQATEPSEDRVLDRSEMARIQELWNPENEAQKAVWQLTNRKGDWHEVQVAGSVRAVDAVLRSQGLFEGHGQGRLAMNRYFPGRRAK